MSIVSGCRTPRVVTSTRPASRNSSISKLPYRDSSRPKTPHLNSLLQTRSPIKQGGISSRDILVTQQAPAFPKDDLAQFHREIHIASHEKEFLLSANATKKAGLRQLQ